VQYNVCGFVEKNMDNLHQNLRSLVQSSHHAFIREEIFLDLNKDTSSTSSGPGGGKGPGAAPRRGSSGGDKDKDQALSRSSRIRADSVSYQFRGSLTELVATLDATEPSYVRCIKPNHFKQPGFFHSSEIIRQLQYAGMMEAIRIRQQGYALRVLHRDFLNEYGRIIKRRNGGSVTSAQTPEREHVEVRRGRALP
jgi:myosin heavy subunit